MDKNRLSCQKKMQGLYLITPNGSEEFILETVRLGLKGGARVVQYRDKERTLEQQQSLASRLKALCTDANALFLVNDNPELARTALADGVHLGQKDTSVSQAREHLGRDTLIGVSTRTVEQAMQAEADGADYIAVGSIFPTDTQHDAELVGPDRLASIRQKVTCPLVAIGGIDANNAALAIKAGADSLAVISAVATDSNPTLAAREMSLLFNSQRPREFSRVMTIAGSDSGGGAGIQADLKTIALLGSFGSSVITVLTAQNTLGVEALSPAPLDFIRQQAYMVLDDIGTDTIKTGMLYSAEIVTEMARIIRAQGLLSVIDPVMIAKGGAPLLKKDAIDALIKDLIPLSFLLTPNIPEAEALTGMRIETLSEMEKAARCLQQMGARHVLLKGGHLKEDATDILLAGQQIHIFNGQRIDSVHTHGTGCSYAAALATFLAQGFPLVRAVEMAKLFITEAIEKAPRLGRGHGPINHFAGAAKVLAQQQQTSNVITSFGFETTSDTKQKEAP